MRRRFNTSITFIDILFNVLSGIFVLLILTMALIAKSKKIDHEGVELKAEFLITMEWDGESLDDVDLWVMDPSGQIVYYGAPNRNGFSLDRDDRGARNDTITLSDGTKEVIKENWEHVTIRRAIPGEYIVNAVMFSKLDKTPTDVTIKLEKLNPYQMVHKGRTTLVTFRQEDTVFRFTIDSSGNVKDISRDPEILTRRAGK